MSKKQRMFIILITSILLLFGSIVSIMSLRYSKRDEFQNVGNQFTSQSSAMLELWIRDQVQLVQQIARDERIVSLCLEPENMEKYIEAKTYLKDMHEAYPYYENLPVAIKTEKPLHISMEGQEFIVENGEFVVDTVNNDTIGKGGPDYSYIDNIFKGESYYISEIYRSIWRKNPIFVVSAPVMANEEIVGVAIISPQMDYFTKLFVDSIKLGETGYMFLVDSSGSVIAHNKRDLILNDSVDSHDTVDYIVDKVESGYNFFEAKLLDVNKYYYARKINIDSEYVENDMYIVIAQEKMEIYRFVHKFATLSLILVVVTSGMLYRMYFLINKNNIQKIKANQLLQMNMELELQVKERTLQLEDMVNRDSLTSLYNHKYVNDYLYNLIEKAADKSEIAVGIVDIDKFKKVNDNYGHQIGDEVIVRVAEILNANMRTYDIVGRYGGEEFLIILKDIDFSECIGIVERIRKEVFNEAFTIDDLKVSVSIGLAKWQGEDNNALVKRADHLMYEAKDKGRNQVVHD